MTPTKADLPQGTLDLLILKVVALGPVHGYAIAQRLDQASRGHSVKAGDRPHIAPSPGAETRRRAGCGREKKSGRFSQNFIAGGA